MNTKMDSYDVIAVGSGFACSFFLKKMLEKKRKKLRILWLERGTSKEHKPPMQTQADGKFIAENRNKIWMLTMGQGGGSNCWWACTPRFLPNDFKMKSLYGVGVDWPIGYEHLEPYYSEAERIMSVSGPNYEDFYPRSQPYPQPPHKFSSVDKALKKQFPTLFFEQPTARARIATQTRPACCSTGVCHQCPINAKFKINYDLASLFQHEDITFRTHCQVEEILHQQNAATGVRFINEAGKEEIAHGDIVALGANGIFNPHLLQRSELHHPKLGKGINDQVSNYVNVDLTGLEGYDGSTSVTGHGFMLYDGEHRREHAACLMETSNILQTIRLEKGKYRQRVNLKFIFEDLPSDRNYVAPSAQNAKLPEITYPAHSDYTQRGIDNMKRVLPRLLEGLPVEAIHHLGDTNKTEAHIQSTTPMGHDSNTSIVDASQQHHKIRNLVVLGSSVFPTAPPPNPTLTISALSLRAADLLSA